MATKPRRGGAKGLTGRATKKRTFFFGFPNKMIQTANFKIRVGILPNLRLEK